MLSREVTKRVDQIIELRSMTQQVKELAENYLKQLESVEENQLN